MSPEDTREESLEQLARMGLRRLDRASEDPSSAFVSHVRLVLERVQSTSNDWVDDGPELGELARELQGLCLAFRAGRQYEATVAGTGGHTDPAQCMEACEAADDACTERAEAMTDIPKKVKMTLRCAIQYSACIAACVARGASPGGGKEPPPVVLPT